MDLTGPNICFLFSLGFSWEAHSTMTAVRYYHTSEVLQNTLYMLGGKADGTQTTTEYFNRSLAERWVPSFDLQETTNEQCSVRLSHSQIAVINGRTNHNYIYNIETGDATGLPDTPQSVSETLNNSPTKKKRKREKKGEVDMSEYA